MIINLWPRYDLILLLFPFIEKKKNPKILLFPLHEQVRRLAEIKKIIYINKQRIFKTEKLLI